MRLLVVLAPLVLPTSAALAAPADPPWTVALSGGATILDGDTARPTGGVWVERALGDVSLGIAGSVIDSGTRGGGGATLRSTTYQLTVSGGFARGAATVDGYGQAGRRTFARRRLRDGTVLVAPDGTTLGAGAQLSYDLPIGPATGLSPFASIDWSRVDTSLSVTIPAGTFARSQRQAGVTGGLGVTLTQAVGRHQLGLTLSGHATSNDASSGGGSATPTAPRRFLDGAGASDQWLEAGPSVSLSLSQRLRLGMTAVRTVGLKAGDATTAAVTVSSRF